MSRAEVHAAALSISSVSGVYKGLKPWGMSEEEGDTVSALKLIGVLRAGIKADLGLTASDF